MDNWYYVWARQSPSSPKFIKGNELIHFRNIR